MAEAMRRSKSGQSSTARNPAIKVAKHSAATKCGQDAPTAPFIAFSILSIPEIPLQRDSATRLIGVHWLCSGSAG
jgi:hypothetical protein